MLDIELQELATDRLCQDYQGETDVSELNLTAGGKLITNITYNNGDKHLHFWSNGEEVFPEVNDINFILDEFYAWY